jgi:hypothetical protein
MFSALLDRHGEPPDEQLLRLYWNRAGVKRELSSLKRERFELLDKLKEQEGAITRAQEQLEGLERLLTNPLAAANALVYFQLRHMWRIASLRLEQFGKELHMQRERRERAQLHEAALAKRKRRLDAVNEKLNKADFESLMANFTAFGDGDRANIDDFFKYMTRPLKTVAHGSVKAKSGGGGGGGGGGEMDPFA